MPDTLTPSQRKEFTMWRLHLTISGQRLTLRGRTRKTLFRLLSRLTWTLKGARLYQRSNRGDWYRSSIRRCLA